MKDKRSLKTHIRYLIYDEYPNWVHGGRLQRLAFELGYLPENAARRGRELVKEEILEKRLNKGSVEYRYREELVIRPSDVTYYDDRH